MRICSLLNIVQVIKIVATVLQKAYMKRKGISVGLCLKNVVCVKDSIFGLNSLW
jgi:hypothetical protein